MDTLSSSVSALKVPLLPPPNRELYHFKTTSYAAPNCPPQPQFHASSISKPNLIPKTKSFCHKDSSSFTFKSTQNSSFGSSSSVFYRKPATGYAAALIDVAQSSNSLHLVQKDVHRLLNLLQNVKFQSQFESSMEMGKFHRHLVVVLKILVKKNKMGIVKEVLEEFERIYEELCGTQVVLVSSEKKIGEDEILGIAKRVQELSGATKVNVRNLVRNDGLASHAA